ncbi:neural-cadherin-like [Eriocheir sinensis]|uniref:neural-cadherin-like n=1 Tax=Eriocheir sinensis TaxID=95602 RepID=UPI0021C622B3|nr:neural-cadherin-like [Eriocheir sinensis]XP_050695670.1 neural-cadherin-like [Eriocheir sinensis]
MVPRGVLGRVGAALVVAAVCVSAEMLPEVMYSVAVPHDVAPAHIVHKIKLKDGQTVNKLMDSEYSDYFAALDNGEVMTVARLSPLLGRVANLRVATKYPNGDTQVFAIRVAVKDHQSMLRFLKPEYDASVYENLPAGTELQDLDDLEAMGEEDVRYELLGGHSVFALHHVGGMPTVVTRQALDREAQDLYRLVLRAYDKEGMDMAEAKINVHILDMNDHAPVFTQSMFYFFVPLNISRFDKLGRVTAHDGDGDKVVYRLAYPSNTFTIVPQTGEIMVIEPPETMVYELELEAFDKRKPTLYSDVLAKAHIEFRYPSDSLFTGESNDIEYDAYPEHVVSKRSAKKRVKRGQLRHTKELVFSEADGAVEKKVVFQLEKEIQWETFKIRDDNPWVEVDSNGAVRIKKKWDYEELGPEKTIDFWVTITNNDRNGEYFALSHSRLNTIMLSYFGIPLLFDHNIHTKLSN